MLVVEFNNLNSLQCEEISSNLFGQCHQLSCISEASFIGLWQGFHIQSNSNREGERNRKDWLHRQNQWWGKSSTYYSHCFFFRLMSLYMKFQKQFLKPCHHMLFTVILARKCCVWYLSKIHHPTLKFTFWLYWTVSSFNIIWQRFLLLDWIHEQPVGPRLLQFDRGKCNWRTNQQPGKYERL